MLISCSIVNLYKLNAWPVVINTIKFRWMFLCRWMWSLIHQLWILLMSISYLEGRLEYGFQINISYCMRYGGIYNHVRSMCTYIKWNVLYTTIFWYMKVIYMYLKVAGAPNLYSQMHKPHEICGYYCCDSGSDN